MENSQHILVFLLFILSCFIAPSHSKSIIKRLPGFDGDLPFGLETGYIGVGKDEAVQIFYYFVESERNPSEDPLLIYLTGGPGTSVLYSMMYQIGPLNFDLEATTENNITLKLNPYSWSKIANVIYIDAPAGAGFAYATTYEASMSSDSLLASDAYDFLRKWFIENPKYLSNPLYIAGISYMGIILPNVALHVYNGNERGDQPHMNIKGVISVSPLTDKYNDFNSRFEFAHRLSLISDDMYQSTKETCDGNYLSMYINNSANILCTNNLQWVDECTSKINLENILEPLCDTTDPACRAATFGLVVKWANNKDVQKALNVREGTIENWEWQNSTIHYDLGKNDTIIYSYDVFSTIPIHKQLLAKKCQYLIICGDHDMVFPHVGTEKWIESFNLPVVKRWEPWFVNDQIAGYQVTYAQREYLLTYATIKGAGHGIALYKPEEALAMVDGWLDSRAYLSDI